MNIKPAEAVLKRPLCTWLTAEDYDSFAAIASANGVTMAAYLRSIVVDAIAEETTVRVEGSLELAVVR